ncbi:RICIN domain-containing protein [Amycolatopsis sp. cg9]|uniref:RICIN domain-containing protein n=1 Tax=Amycolatopsis sp. cg9 TaxID=3238801 RepID=UPI003526357B
MTWFHLGSAAPARRWVSASVLAMTAWASIGLAVSSPAAALPNPDCTEIPGPVEDLCSVTLNKTDQQIGVTRNFCGPDDAGGPCPNADPDRDFKVLGRGERTPANEDWDAFFVPPGCVFSGNIDIRLTNIDRDFTIPGGPDGFWVRVPRTAIYEIEQTACAHLTDHVVRLRNQNSGLCLLARNTPGENAVVQYPCGAYADQRWQMPGNGVDLVQLRNLESQKCVATRGTGESPGIATTCASRWVDQIWRREPDPSTGNYRLRNLNSGLCLVVRGTAAETRALQSTCGTWPDQLWTMLV